MRELTNKFNLPLPLFYAIKNDTYEARGDISTTTLIDSPYIRCMRKYNTYTEDATEMIWALQGQSIHATIERMVPANNEDFISEKKLEMSVQYGEETRVLTGTPDLIERIWEIDANGQRVNVKNILHDFKNIFVSNAQLGIKSSSHEKWSKQTNIYVALIKHCLGFQIHEIQIHAFIRDWSKSKKKYFREYPELPMQTYFLPVYSHNSIVEYINRRIKLHFDTEQMFKDGKQDEIPVCEPEDRWARPEVWKIMKQGAKRSMRNFGIKTEEDKANAMEYYALKLMDNPKLIINKVPGEDIRCLDYCPVNDKCKFYKEKYGKAETKPDSEGEDSTSVFDFDIFA